MKNPMEDRSSLDSFWDLSDLVPSGRRSPKRGAFAEKITPKAPEDTTAPASARPAEERRLSYSSATVEELREYHPQDNYLLETVRIYAQKDNYPFYGRFRRDAERYLSAKGRECPYVPFFSYIPQYSQLKPDQLAYYLYFRDCVRRGEYPRTDESYFYLYVYEIINLPDKIPPEEGVLHLARVWGAYRGNFPRIDKYMAEWLCDYCLVHGLPSPGDLLRPFRAKILPHASLREFYLGEMGELSPAGVDTALAFFSDYRFRDSRYAQGTCASDFEKDILASLAPVLRSVFSDREEALAGAEPRTLVRDAFCGSLCAHQVRSRIEVVYYAIPDAEHLRALLTNAVKYAENRIRIRMAVKSRLAVRDLAPEYRRMIDAYFLSGDGNGEDRNGPRAIPVSPLAFSVDPNAAAAIELDSWETTKRLVYEDAARNPADAGCDASLSSATTAENGESPVVSSSFSLEDRSEIAGNFVAERKDEGGASQKDGAALSVAAKEYLLAILQADFAAIRRICISSGRMEDELAEEINEMSMNTLGDIALEIGDAGYTLIPDYLDEVEKWTK